MVRPMSTPFFRSARFVASDDSRRSTWGLLLVAVLLLLWISWFVFARVAVYAVSDSADLEVDRAAHPVEAQFTGRVMATNLALDREVQAGEVLVQLDADAEKLQLAEEQTRLTAFSPQINSLQDQIAAEDNAWQQEKRTAEVALDEARAHYREGEAAAEFAQKQADRLHQMYEQGVLSKVEWDRGQADAQQRRAAADGLRFAVTRLERQQLTEQEDRQARLQGLRSEVNRLQGQKVTTQAETKRLQNEVDLRLIRAPVSGTLGEVANLRIGSVVREGEKLAAVVPPGRLRVVANFLPPDALGRVRPGQSARMRLEGFPWVQFGSVSATVTNVASEVRDGRIRVELGVNSTSTSRIPLQHGLPGSVEVQVERISPVVLVLRMVGRKLNTPRSALASVSRGAQP
jgi:multidrug resistance efflux pump